MRLGLGRMRRLTAALGTPQHRFASIHVVGTNGKSSVAQLTAALLEAHGIAAGCYLSPHLSSWSERLRIGAGGGGTALVAALEGVAAAAATVDRTLPDGEAVTQFEAATAAALAALAEAGVEVAVIEAGLGGRLDATNVIPSRLAALTSVGLDHTEWLGDTEEQIATEKLAVLKDRSALVVGDLSPAVLELAERTAAARHAALVRPREVDPELASLLPGGYLRQIGRAHV